MEDGQDARRSRIRRGSSHRKKRKVPADPLLTARHAAAIAAIDRAHAEDPAGRELDYAVRMTRWLDRLAPNASEILRLAGRGQHLRRWEIPRDSYPATRKGYHEWRRAQAAAHARTMSEILRAAGYDESTALRVGSILRKENLGTDPEVQSLEDAACLVFLERELAEFSERHADEKTIGILRKTWGKMSAAGRAAALEIAPSLPPAARELIGKALAP